MNLGLDVGRWGGGGGFKIAVMKFRGIVGGIIDARKTLVTKV